MSTYVEKRLLRDEIAELAACLACGGRVAASIAPPVARGADLAPLWHAPPLVPLCASCARDARDTGPLARAVLLLLPAVVGAASVHLVPIDLVYQPCVFLIGVVFTQVVLLHVRGRRMREIPVVLLGGERDTLRYQLRVAPERTGTQDDVTAARAVYRSPAERAQQEEVEAPRMLDAPRPSADSARVWQVGGVVLGALATLTLSGGAYPLMRVANRGHEPMTFHTNGGVAHHVAAGTQLEARIQWGYGTLHIHREGEPARRAPIRVTWGNGSLIAVYDDDVCQASLLPAEILALRQAAREQREKLGQPPGPDPDIACTPLGP